MIFRLTEIDSKVLLILDSAWLGLTHINGDENVRSILLSGRSEVQILLATPKTPPKTLIFQGFRRFLFSEKSWTYRNMWLAGVIFANQIYRERLNSAYYSHGLALIFLLMISKKFFEFANQTSFPANLRKILAKNPANLKGDCYKCNRLLYGFI